MKRHSINIGAKQMPNKRTGPDYLDKKKKTETVQELLLRDKPKKPKAKPKQPKMGSAEGWADLRKKIKKDKEKQKKNRKTLPHKI